jgi:hypothetical protein
MPIWCRLVCAGCMVAYDATEHHAKMDYSYSSKGYRHATCIDHSSPLGRDVQRDEIRQYAPNQSSGYVHVV